MGQKRTYKQYSKEYKEEAVALVPEQGYSCLLYTSPSPRDVHKSRMPSSA